MIWSEYALSYDRVLLASNTYLQLLDRCPGRTGSARWRWQPDSNPSGVAYPRPGSRDRQSARMLAKQQRRHVIFAIENNRIMLDLLRDKCDAYLRLDDRGPGILAIKQDVNTLFGIHDGTFDYAVLNNVAYALDDPLPCFRKCARHLSRMGRFASAALRRRPNCSRSSSRLMADLDASGQMTELREEFQRVWDINRNDLGPRLYRWTVDDMMRLLHSAALWRVRLHE